MPIQTRWAKLGHRPNLFDHLIGAGEQGTTLPSICLGAFKKAKRTLRDYCNYCFTFSGPALTHSSSFPGEPDRPTPPTHHSKDWPPMSQMGLGHAKT